MAFILGQIARVKNVTCHIGESEINHNLSVTHSFSEKEMNNEYFTNF